MTLSPVLEFVIILLLIFSLYSLLAILFSEVISSVIRLRARTLRYGISRMLQDTPGADNLIAAYLANLRDSIARLYNYRFRERSLVRSFFNRPSIKYLGQDNLTTTPSYLAPRTFAHTLIDILRREFATTELKDIESTLEYDYAFDYPITIDEDDWNGFVEDYQNTDDKNTFLRSYLTHYIYRPADPFIQFDPEEAATLLLELQKTKDHQQILELLRQWQKEHRHTQFPIDKETRLHLLLLLRQANGDIHYFRKLLEKWFIETMERVQGWYKGKMLFISFLVGLSIAAFFNLNIFQMGSHLINELPIRSALLIQADNQAEFDAGLLLESNSAIMEVFSLPREFNAHVLNTILGYFISALLIAFGSAFWFDVITKWTNIRTVIPNSGAEEAKSIKYMEDEFLL